MTREVYGPLEASWCVVLADSPRSGTTQVATRERARSTVAYFAREGRACHVTRTELCPMSGCNGDGTRSVRRRGRLYATDVPCKGCRGRVDTVEDPAEFAPRAFDADTPLALVLVDLGYALTVEPIRCHVDPDEFVAVRWHVTIGELDGWPAFTGAESSVRSWLFETGQVLNFPKG